MNFYNTLLVILTVNCREFLLQTLSILTVDRGEFYQRLRSEKIGRRIAVNFYNTLLVISMVDFGEFHEGLRSEKIGR